MDDNKKDVNVEQDALSIINDPKNNLNINTEEREAQEAKAGVSRRNLLKYGGMIAAAASVATSAVTGYETGASADGYTGWGRQYLGKDQFFNREPFRSEYAAMMEPVGDTSERADWHQFYLRRITSVFALIATKQWNPKQGVDAMPGYLGDFYRANPDEYAGFTKMMEILGRRTAYIRGEGYDKYKLAEAYKQSYKHMRNPIFGMALPEQPNDALKRTGEIQPPEKWDYRYVNKKAKKMEFKSPKHATELIKTMTHRFGASCVGIAKFDERFMFKNMMRGYPNLGVEYGDKVPAHWKSVIVFAIPSEWDKAQATPSFTSAADGYYRVCSTAGLLERFMQELGYSGRAQTPENNFEIMATPFVMSSGLGEYARAGYAMIPEIGSNFRVGAVITDLEFEYDKPINIGMAKFCKKCKICADTCPSGAIETTDEPTQIVRGFKRWVLDSEKCFQGWSMTVNGGCSVCIGVCPFTRKNTWIHAISRELDARDSFGVVGSTLLTMQLNFFKYPTSEEFRAPFEGGQEAVYHNPPEWLKTEEWFENVVKTWEYEGMH